MFNGTMFRIIPAVMRKPAAGIRVGIFVLLAGLASGSSFAQEITGIWWTPKKDGKLEFYIETSGTLSGRLIAMPPKTATDLDGKNPDPQLRSRRLLGLVVFSGFKPETKTKWIDGKAYDPQTGGLYGAKLWLEGSDTMMLRGYLGISLFGMNETLTRVTGNSPRTKQAGEPDLVYLADERVASKGKNEKGE